MTLLLGKKGQLAWGLQRQFKTALQSLGSQDINLNDPGHQLIALLEKVRPKVIINATGIHDLETVEKNPEACLQLNVKTPLQIAQWCSGSKALYIHFTGVDVFDGKGSDFRQESEKTSPINHLGRQFVEVENGIAKSGSPHLLFRSNWMFAPVGNNFVRNFLAQAENQSEIFVDHEQVSSPTSVLEFGKAVVKVLEKLQGIPQIPSGIYHLTGHGTANLKDWGQELLAQATGLGFRIQTSKIHGKSWKDQGAMAVRPLNARLSNQKILRNFGVQLPDWNDSLLKVLHETKKNC